jgi:adenosylcobinamide hydrolase
MNIPIEGISISNTLEVVHVQSASPLATLSSAIVGSGFQRVHHILNFHVDKNYYCPNPKADLQAFAGHKGINERFVGLLTAVNLNKARLVFLKDDGLSVGALVTAGVSNAASAGVTPPFSHQPGTINIILILDARLTRAAMLNAVITATEAKSAILAEMNIRTAHGDPATGTSTDTVTVAATGKGNLQSYAGPVTTLGWLIARAVRQAVHDSILER